MRNPLLDPVVVGVLPRWSDAAYVLSEMPVDHALALAADDQQAQRFRQHWSAKEDFPLLLLRCSVENSVSLAVDAVSEIASHGPRGPLSVLLADGPEATGFREEGRKDWNRKFAKALSEAILDVQVFEYASTWATQPPRFR